MTAVLLGSNEVLVIVIVTAVIVFLIARGKGRRPKK
jgi:hypothetical protein